MAKTLSATIGLLFLFVFVALFGLTGCEKIVEVEKTVYDTVTVPVEVPKGPAYVRFVSLLPDRATAGVALYKGPTESSAPFGLAGDHSRNEFIPVTPRQAMTLYAFYFKGSTKIMDSILLPPFEPTEMYTCAVFGIEDPGSGETKLAPGFSWDSLKVVPASEGKAYLRLVNGLADYPTPSPTVNLKLKSSSAEPLFPEPVPYSKIANYVEIPTGTYQLFLAAADEPGSILNIVALNVAQGAYYTAMVYGRKSDNTAKLAITVEN